MSPRDITSPLSGAAATSAAPRVLIDFDGTIATVDTTDAVLSQFALPEWEEIEAEWKAGRIGSRECMGRQIALIRATPATLDAFIDTLTIDAGVTAFIELAVSRGADVSIVSDGLDRTVRRVLSRHGIRGLPIRANAMRHLGSDRWRLDFPFATVDCRALAGNCKCQFTAPDIASLVVGDGRSDFCVAERATFVLAKKSLLAHARTLQLPYAPFETFAEATVHLGAWLDAATVAVPA